MKFSLSTANGAINRRAGNSVRHAFRRQLCLITLVQRHQRHHETEHHALNDAVGNIVLAITIAQKRGARTRCNGSTAIIFIADNCSPAFIRLSTKPTK